MDSCISARAATRCSAKAKARSDAINMEIEEDDARYKRECKFSPWAPESPEGAPSSKVFARTRFSRTKLARFRSIIYRNLFDSMQSVIVHTRKISFEYADYRNRVLAGKILDYRLMIHTFPRNCGCHLPTQNSFCGEALRISAPGYLSNKADVLRALYKSQGMTESCFAMGQLSG
ncbi:hypothetical protein BD779DRAFT_1702075 [Infundibulicybe gibba]|nr:hypothetical protein BD779DRAFT_1702075 [Infundibulicybe gibba]